MELSKTMRAYFRGLIDRSVSQHQQSNKSRNFYYLCQYLCNQSHECGYMLILHVRTSYIFVCNTISFSIISSNRRLQISFTLGLFPKSFAGCLGFGNFILILCFAVLTDLFGSTLCHTYPFFPL